jgi:hypothetical protein
MSLERVNVLSGGLVRFDTSKGDMLGYVYMTKHDPVTDTMIPTPITFTLMSTRLGEQIIDQRDLTYLNTIRLALETKNESQAKTPTGFQPLWLPFSHVYFPLIAVRHTQLDLVFEGLDPAYRYKVWAQFIHLPYEERIWFEMQPHKIAIQQVKRFVPINGDVCLSGPVKYIAWPSLNYTSQLFSQQAPVLVSPGNVIINTSSANTFSVTQTINFYNQATLQWSTSALPSGVTFAATNDQITFSLAQSTSFASQTFQVTATTPYGKSSTVNFFFVANPLVTFYSVVANPGVFYAINLASNPVLTVLRGSVVVFNLSSSTGYPFVIQTVASPYSAGNIYTTGITNANSDNGSIIWEVSPFTQATLYYVARTSSIMTSTINVVS